jgi:hypothetical protein
VQYLGRGSDGRTPTYSQVDLYLQQSFKLGKTKTLQFSVNVLNLLNQETAIARFQTETEASDTGNAAIAGISVSENAFYRGGVNTAALMAAQSVPRDPRFLKDSEFQEPREIRLGLRFTF